MNDQFYNSYYTLTVGVPLWVIGVDERFHEVRFNFLKKFEVPAVTLLFRMHFFIMWVSPRSVEIHGLMMHSISTALNFSFSYIMIRIVMPHAPRYKQ